MGYTTQSLLRGEIVWVVLYWWYKSCEKKLRQSRAPKPVHVAILYTYDK